MTIISIRLVASWCRCAASLAAAISPSPCTTRLSAVLAFKDAEIERLGGVIAGEAPMRRARASSGDTPAIPASK